MHKWIQACQSCFGLPHRHLGQMMLILLAGKVGFVLLRGVSYEMDSVTYLFYHVPFHHPPLYSLLLWLLQSLTHNVHVYVGVPLVLFCLVAGLSLSSWFKSTRARYLAACVVALDPITGFFCSNLMSECLFVSLLLPWTATVTYYLEEREDRRSYGILLLAALLGAALYATRLAAILFPPFFVVMLVWRTRTLRAVLLPALVYVLAFQAFLLPVKLLYYVRYDTFSVTAFTGTNLWNNASPLYPDSSIRTDPTTEFERFLATRDTEEFTTSNALTGWPIEAPESGYTQYLEMGRFRPRELTAFERELAGTAKRLILEKPVGYLTRFVMPNLVKPLHIDEMVPISPEVAATMERVFGYSMVREVRYSSRIWSLYFALLCAATIGLALRRFRCRPAAVPIALSWYYLLALPVVVAITPRYMLTLAPLILVGLLLALLPAERPSGSSGNSG
jgi:hypothetical protein